ncbi:MAG: FG-GAP repeat protein, partial [Thermoplasmata archaeon]|nr:FG-GAP repeat protein [Thermoplasmata archaeon]
NMTYISNLNGDIYPDLVISTPWYDSALADVGAVFIFWGKADSGFDDINHSQADVTILGVGLGNNFGWDVADAGDVNNDGINDLIVGAPGALNNKGRAYIFYGGTIPDGNFPASNLVDRMLEGKTANGFYGTAVTGMGDINNDGYGDVLVGAPGADQTVITYGYKNKVTFYPDLWDDDLSTPGLIDFSNGVNNFLNATYTDNNSWGLDGDDDGWDWIDSFSDPTRLYGRTIPAPQDHANLYAPWEPDSPDADGLTWSNRTALEVMIGRNHTDYNPYGLDNDSEYDPGASAAWGIEFNITAEMYNYLSSNSTITLGFDYCAMDSNRIYNNSNRSRRIISIIRSRIWNGTTIDYIGNEFQSNKKCVFYKEDPSNTPPWGPIYDSFKWDITDYFDHIGSYYWDFGCYFDRCYKNRADDGLMAFFDNITMKITNDKSVPIVGMKNSGFGSSITALGDINGDGYPDAMIGAPNLDGGYAAIISGKKRFNTSESIGISTIILTGSNHGDKFGYSVADAGDVDNDGIVDVIIGAPGGNYANLYYGSTLNAPLLVPDLWEVDEDKSTSYIEFDSGLKSTGNTPGRTSADDGWDIWNGVYGFQSGETPGSSVMYNGANNIDSPQVASDDELIIYIGGNLGGGGWFDARKDSGAYGVKFSVSQNMITALESGAEAILSYDCRFKNLGLDQDDTVWIKTFIRNSAGDHALGWALDKDTLDNDNKDD